MVWYVCLLRYPTLLRCDSFTHFSFQLISQFHHIIKLYFDEWVNKVKIKTKWTSCPVCMVYLLESCDILNSFQTNRNCGKFASELFICFFMKHWDCCFFKHIYVYSFCCMHTEKNQGCLCSQGFRAILQSLVTSAARIQLNSMVMHIPKSVNSQYFRDGDTTKENGYPYPRVYQ